MPSASERGALRLGVAGAMNALSQGSQIAVVAVLAGDEQVGSLAAAIALFTPLMFMVQGRAQDLIATAPHDPAQTRRALAGRIGVGLFLAGGAGIGIGAAIGFDGETLLAGAFLALARGAEVGSQMSYGEYLHEGRPRLVARSLWLRSILTVVATVALVAVFETGASAAAALALAWLVALVAVDRRGLFPTGAHGMEPAELKRLRRSSFELGFAFSLAALIPGVPRLALFWFDGTGDLGRFATVAFVARAPAQVPLAMSQAIGPEIARELREHPGRMPGHLRRALLTAAGFGVVWTAIGFVVIRTLVPEILESGYVASVFTSLVLLAGSAALFVSTPLEQAAIAARTTFANMNVLIASALVATVTAAVAVPAMGIEGAALALFAANLFRLGALSAVIGGVLR